MNASLAHKAPVKADFFELARKSGLFLLFFAIGIAVFILGCNYYKVFTTNQNAVYEGGLAAVLLLASVIMQRQERLSKYAELFYMFFVASFVYFITTVTGGFRAQVLASQNVQMDTSFGFAIAKICEAATTIPTILVLMWVRGISLKSIYLQRGNLKWGLIIGVGLVLNFLTSSVMFSYTRFATPGLLGAAVLWGIVFSLANGFMEELWIRALFLRRLEALIGSGGAILLTAVWWSLMHAFAYYFTPAAIPIFLTNLLTFGLAYGYVMRKTDSLVGPGLMHAASDIFLFIATLAAAG